MNGLMKGKRGLVMGVANNHSIAWGIAKTLADHGAELAFTYQGERLRENVEELTTAFGAETLTLPCDVTRDEEMDRVFELLQAAKRPVFVVGRGLISENVTAAMASLASCGVSPSWRRASRTSARGPSTRMSGPPSRSLRSRTTRCATVSCR